MKRETQKKNWPLIFVYLSADAIKPRKITLWRQKMDKLREKLNSPYRDKTVEIHFRVLTTRTKVSSDLLSLTAELGLETIHKKTGIIIYQKNGVAQHFQVPTKSFISIKAEMKWYDECAEKKGRYKRTKTEKFEDSNFDPPLHMVLIGQKGRVMSGIEQAEWVQNRIVLGSFLIDTEEASNNFFEEDQYFIHFNRNQNASEDRLIETTFENLDSQINDLYCKSLIGKFVPEQIIDPKHEAEWDKCDEFARIFGKDDEMEKNGTEKRVKFNFKRTVLETYEKQGESKENNKKNKKNEKEEDKEKKCKDEELLKSLTFEVENPKKRSNLKEKKQEEKAEEGKYEKKCDVSLPIKTRDSFTFFIRELEIEIALNIENSEKYKLLVSKLNLQYLIEHITDFMKLKIGDAKKFILPAIPPLECEISHTETGWRLDVVSDKRCFRFFNGQWQEYTKIKRDAKDDREFKNESQVLKKINSEYVMKLEYASKEKSATESLVITEKADGHLQEVISDEKWIPGFLNLFLIVYTACMGLRDIHVKRYLHTQLDPNHIFLIKKGSSFIAKIGGLNHAEESHNLVSNQSISKMQLNEYSSENSQIAAGIKHDGFHYDHRDDACALVKILKALCEASGVVNGESVICCLMNRFDGWKERSSISASLLFGEIDNILRRNKEKYPELKAIELYLEAETQIKLCHSTIQELSSLSMLCFENRNELMALQKKFFEMQNKFSSSFGGFYKGFSDLTGDDIVGFRKIFNDFKSEYEKEKDLLDQKEPDKEKKVHFVKELLEYRYNLEAEIASGKETDSCFASLFYSRHKSVKKKFLDDLFDYFETGMEPDFKIREIMSTQNGRLKKVLDIAKDLGVLPMSLYEEEIRCNSFLAQSAVT